MALKDVLCKAWDALPDSLSEFLVRSVPDSNLSGNCSKWVTYKVLRGRGDI